MSAFRCSLSQNSTPLPSPASPSDCPHRHLPSLPASVNVFACSLYHSCFFFTSPAALFFSQSARLFVSSSLPITLRSAFPLLPTFSALHHGHGGNLLHGVFSRWWALLFLHVPLLSFLLALRCSLVSALFHTISLSALIALTVSPTRSLSDRHSAVVWSTLLNMPRVVPRSTSQCALRNLNEIRRKVARLSRVDYIP